MESVDNGEHHRVRYRADPVWRWCRSKSRQTIIRGIVVPDFLVPPARALKSPKLPGF